MADDGYAAQIREMADSWRAFPLDVFSADGLAAHLGPDRGTALDMARLTAGAIMSATETLVDHLFDDLRALEESGVENAAQYDGDDLLIALDRLPPRFQHQYGPLFVRKFLVATVSVTERLAHPDEWRPLTTLVEELALHLLTIEAVVILEGGGLAHLAYPEWLGVFDDLVLEDSDYEMLYDPSLDGLDESAVGASAGMAPMSFSSWFRPYNHDRHTHPYASDDASQN